MTRGIFIGTRGETILVQRRTADNRAFSGRGGLASFYNRKEKRKNGKNRAETKLSPNLV